MELLGLTYDEHFITKQSKQEFKTLVKSLTNREAFNQLKSMQPGHTKTKKIIYNTFKIQQYIESPALPNKLVELLFAMRSSMIKGIKLNFKTFYSDSTTCPLKCQENPKLDEQSHL